MFGLEEFGGSQDEQCRCAVAELECADPGEQRAESSGHGGLQRGPSIPARYLYVDGILDDIGSDVLRDRQTLADEGVVVMIATTDGSTGSVISGPEIVTRGWVPPPPGSTEPRCTDGVGVM